jgi:hypothetical protein
LERRVGLWPEATERELNVLYEKKLEQARADLAHVTAAIRIFAATDRPQDIRLKETEASIDLPPQAVMRLGQHSVSSC